MIKKSAAYGRQIRPIDGTLDTSVAIIRAAFGTVAKEKGYTEENAPRYTAFTTVARLQEIKDRGAVFFGLHISGKQVGFVAVEKEADSKAYMKRLAVLPEYWHGGLGRELVNYAIRYWQVKGEKKLYIAVAGDHGVLNDWYKKMGFKETSVEQFEHLPFKVSYMELDISDREG
jgi:ribosomal protein S18 acetylase RimI-like enzyme